MHLIVTALRRTARFDADVRRAAPDIQKAARDAANKLLAESQAGSLRLHPLKGLPKPMVFKIDVMANHSWQITFELVGQTANLLRLADHKTIDRNPR